MPRSLFRKGRSSMDSSADQGSIKSSSNPLNSLRRAGDHLRPHTAVTSTNRAPGKSDQDVAAGTSVPVAQRANQDAAGAGGASGTGAASTGATAGGAQASGAQGHQSTPSSGGYSTQSGTQSANDSTQATSDERLPYPNQQLRPSSSRGSSFWSRRASTASGRGQGERSGASERYNHSSQPSQGTQGTQSSQQGSQQGSSSSPYNYGNTQNGQALQGTYKSQYTPHATSSKPDAEPDLDQRQDQQDLSKRTQRVMEGAKGEEEAPNADGTAQGEQGHGEQVPSGYGENAQHPDAPAAQLTSEQRTRQEHIARQMGVPVPAPSGQTSAPSPRIGTQYQRQYAAHEALPTQTPGNMPKVYDEERAHGELDESRMAVAPNVRSGAVPEHYKFHDSDVRMPLDVPGLAVGNDDPMARNRRAAAGAGAGAPAQDAQEGETRRPPKEDRSDVSQNVDQKDVEAKRGTKAQQLEHARSRYADFAGWRQVGGWNSGEKQDQGGEPEDDLLSRATLLDDYINNKYLGDWYQNTALIVLTAFFAWLIGRLRMSISWLSLVLLFAGTAYRTGMRRIKRNYRDDVVREMSLETLTEDKESMEWLNSFLVKFWLIYEPSLSQMITQIANEILEEQTPPMVQSLALEKFTLGTKAPRLEFVRSFPRTDPTVAVMDFSASFTPNDVMDLTSRQLKRKVNPKVQLGIRIGKGFVSKSLPILVEDMSFSGTMRFRIKMMPRFPHIQTVDVSFISPPNFDFVLKPVGGDTFGFDINIVPGLSKFIKEMVHANLGPMFYAPNAFQVDVEQMMAGVGVMSGVGVLTVTVESASDLRKPENRDGQVDPYVTVCNHTGAEMGRTKIKTGTDTPVFKENIPVIITNVAESVELRVMGFNSKLEDRTVGVVSLSLQKVLDECGDDVIESEILSGGRPTGKLRYSIHYSPVHMPDPNAQGASVRDTKSGILALTIHGARNLDPSLSKIRELSPFCELEINGEPSETTKTTKSNNDPDWGYAKELIIPNKTGCFMVFRVRHYKGKKSSPQVGLLKIRLQDLLLQNEKGRAWFPLEKGKGDLHISTQWKPCPIAAVAGSSYVEPIGMLRLFIKSANDLRNLEHVGKVDPYVRVFLAGRQVGRTEYFKGTLNPVYDEALYIPVQNELQTLELECMDTESRGKDRSLGSFLLDLEDYIQSNDQGGYKVFASDQVYTQRLVMQDRGPKGSVSFAVEFYPAIRVIAPTNLDKVHESKKEIADIKAKKEPTEEDQEKLDVLEQRVAISGVDLKLEKQLEYQAGVVAVTIDTIEGLSRGQALRVTRDNNPMPLFVSAMARSQRLVVGDSFDYLTGQLDLSSMRFEVIDGGESEDGSEESAAHRKPAKADHVIGARKLLEEAYFAPKTYPFELKENIRITLSARYFPTPDFKITSAEDLSEGGLLEVNVMRANDVEAADTSGTSDPYVAFYVNDDKDKVYKTKTIKKTLNPVWNEKFKLQVTEFSSMTLKAIVSDWDMGNPDDPLGGAAFSCADLKPLEYQQFKEPLTDKVRKGKGEKQKGKEREGTLEIGLRFVPGLPPKEKELGLGGALGKHAGAAHGAVLGVAGAAVKPHKTLGGLLGLGKHDDDEDDEAKTSYSVSVDKVLGLGSIKEIQLRVFSLDMNEKELYRSKNIKVENGNAEFDDAVFDFETTPSDQLGFKVLKAKPLGHSSFAQGSCDIGNGTQTADLGDCSVVLNISKLD